MRVLFVNDDPTVSAVTEQTLSRLSGWEIEHESLGARALDALEAGSFDAVVTAMYLSDMSGAEFLKNLNERFPKVIRVVLSDQATGERVIRAVSVSHQFLTRPFKSDVLKRSIERAYNLQNLLADELLRSTLGGMDRLPPLPENYAALQRALGSADANAGAIAEIVGSDAALGAKVLQMANSSFYGGFDGVSDIDAAVMRLGFDVIKTVVLAVEVFESCEPGRPIEGFNPMELQEHSLRTAELAKEMLKGVGLATDAYTAGMLQDIGQLILASQLPDRLESTLERAASSGSSLYEAERDMFGTTHAEIGAYLLGLWGLPYRIVGGVAYHHEPSRAASDGVFGIPDALYVANAILHDTEIDEAYLESMGVADRFNGWKRLAA